MKDRKHVALVDSDCARRAGITLHGSVSAMSRQKSRNPLRFMAIVWTAWLNKSSQELEWGFHCSGCRKSHHRPPTLQTEIHHRIIQGASQGTAFSESAGK